LSTVFENVPMVQSAELEFEDRVLKCVECGADFVFTAAEQSFFYEKQFRHDPKHCKNCKAKRASGNARTVTETRIHCSECGVETTVPFKPTRGKPVLCRSCFMKQRATAPLPSGPHLMMEKSPPAAHP
jgi:CxxC-x17-CxxC domain-containing protein